MAENGMSLQQRLEDTVLASIDDLQEIAEEMFTRFYAASGTAAAEREKTRVLMQEIQRLEKENGWLRTELDNEQDKLARARDENEKCIEIVKNQLRAVEKLKEENRVLSEENYKMETQIRQMVAKEAKDDDPSVSLEADSSLCAREPLGAATCPKCGSMDVRMNVIGEGMHRCEVCGKTFGVHQDG